MSAFLGQPIRLSDSNRILTRDECEVLVKRIHEMTVGGGETDVDIASSWSGELRWARNRVSLAGDRREITVQIWRRIRAAQGAVSTNQVDDASLLAAVRSAERAALFGIAGTSEFVKLRAPLEQTTPKIWSDSTFAETAPERGIVARAIIDVSEAKDMLSAGYLQVDAQTTGRFHAKRPTRYAERTGAQCSMTVRDQLGTGSGWAGGSSYDIRVIDTQALTTRALDKAIASRNPVSLEPGRYTVILEPQAVDDLIRPLIERLSRTDPEQFGAGPFVAGFDNALKLWRSKLGLKVIDERITISHDPMDPLLGVIPFSEMGDPYRSAKWIDRGVLAQLPDYRDYALQTRNDDFGFPNSMSFRMSGGTTTTDEMIATTKRGLLVTRLSGVNVLDSQSMLMTGLTRDGLWLVENGKISKAVKNFRFTESPLFVLNSLDQLGEPVPVYSPDLPAIVPPLKARDFSFTSLVDAV
ncbi:MAG TPA: metallopeptidase TldD-related protein [Gemmatimonadaceae bacterium]|jgi:predicted Zn-dependent protease|nr:metallopeptidase TldD-related protein [Gemmatimonadaceae bacterium]